MVQNLCFFVVFNAVVYLSYIYALRPFWDDSPYVPDESVKFYCYAWMQFYSIYLIDKSDCTIGNKARAKIRDKRYDQEHHVWTACYAYFLSSFHDDSLSMQDNTVNGYCRRVNPDNKLTKYLALQDTKLTCTDWIHYYGYNNDNQYIRESEIMDSTIAFMNVNVKMALKRVKEDDNDPHFLIAMYSQYLEDKIAELGREYSNAMDHIDDVLTPLHFCGIFENLPGNQINPLEYSFATLDTQKSCQDWIYLTGYSNNVEHNIGKALNESKEIRPYQSKWTIDYIGHIIYTYKNNKPPSLDPEEYCITLGLPRQNKVYYKRALMLQ